MADDDRPLYVISIAAQLAGMHPQTLRTYDRLGLVTPGRTAGRGRRYSERDVALLREVQRLSQDEGINLAGIKRIIELEHQVDALRRRVGELQADLGRAADDAKRREQELHASYRRDLVPVKNEITLWRTHGR
jgi:MerR family transcriptional regulator/heat shock protein HspR